MDKVDAKTRETAVTLLDVLWTSKAAGEAAIKTSTSLTSSATSNQSTGSNDNAADPFSRPVATDGIIHGSAPTTTTLRHGFDTNGWGNDTTVQLPLSTNRMTNKAANIDNNSRQNRIIDCDAEKNSKPKKRECDPRSMQQRQQRQPMSLNTASASSTVLAAPMTAVYEKQNNPQNQNQGGKMMGKKRFECNQYQSPSQKFQHIGFPHTNNTGITASVDSNRTTPMMISMKSIGFGIDNSNSSQNDATDATIKAIQDAMERSTLRCQTFHSHSLQIKIKLGVPSIQRRTRSDDSTTGTNSSETRKIQGKTQPMNVDLGRLTSVLPRVISILPVQVDVGGIFVPGEAPGDPSICVVVACITLESKSWLSSESQGQKNPSPQVSVVPPPPCPSPAFETFTSGSRKQTSVQAATLNEAMTNPEQQEDLRQQQYFQMNQQPTKLQPKYTTTTLQHLENDQATSQRWPDGNSLQKFQEESQLLSGKATVSSLSSQHISMKSNFPPSSLLYRTQLTTRSARSSTSQINFIGDNRGEKRALTLMSTNEYPDTCNGGTGEGKRRYQTQHDEPNEKILPPVARQSSNVNANSIEILAMISEQEIIRRKMLDANGAFGAKSEGFNHVASDKSPTIIGGKSRAGIGVSGSGNILQGGEIPEDSGHYERGYQETKTGGPFSGAQQNITGTISSHQSHCKRNDTGEINSNLGPKNINDLRKTDVTSLISGTGHFTTPVIYQKKDNTESIHSITATGSLNLTKSPSVRHPPRLSSRPSNKIGRSRGGGRSIPYSDYSNEHPLPEERDCWALSTRTTSSPVFPLKLHETLSQIEKDGFDDIIGWLPHGRSFKIHKQKEFTDIILPRYFVMTKKSSFLRQLNLYSFNRFSAGTADKGSYYHEKFLRGKKFLSRRMTRQKVNGNRIRSAGNPDEEPDLSMYPICRDDDNNNSRHLSLSTNSSKATSLIATSTVGGLTIIPTKDTLLSSSTSPSKPSLVHTNPTPPASDSSTSVAIGSRSDSVGTSQFLRVL